MNCTRRYIDYKLNNRLTCHKKEKMRLDWQQTPVETNHCSVCDLFTYLVYPDTYSMYVCIYCNICISTVKRFYKNISQFDDSMHTGCVIFISFRLCLTDKTITFCIEYLKRSVVGRSLNLSVCNDKKTYM